MKRSIQKQEEKRERMRDAERFAYNILQALKVGDADNFWNELSECDEEFQELVYASIDEKIKTGRLDVYPKRAEESDDKDDL